MKFESFILFLFLIYEMSFYFVTGHIVEEKEEVKVEEIKEEVKEEQKEEDNEDENNDCTKYYNFIHRDNEIYSSLECCTDYGISCSDKHITYIDGSNNSSFKNIENLAFPNFEYLETLKLCNTSIKFIPDDSFNLPKLVSLDLSMNEIETIPSSISNSPNLKELWLTNNKIKNLSKVLFKLSNLESLYLNENEIETIPPSIGELKKLKKLSLDNNKLDNLPDELFKLPYLETLSVDANLIKKYKFSIQKYEIINQNVKNFNTIKFGIAFGCIFIFIISVLVTFILIKNRKFKKYNNEPGLNSKEVYNKSIEIILNNKRNNNVHRSPGSDTTFKPRMEIESRLGVPSTVVSLDLRRTSQYHFNNIATSSNPGSTSGNDRYEATEVVERNNSYRTDLLLQNHYMNNQNTYNTSPLMYTAVGSITPTMNSPVDSYTPTMNAPVGSYTPMMNTAVDSTTPIMSVVSSTTPVMSAVGSTTPIMNTVDSISPVMNPHGNYQRLSNYLGYINPTLNEINTNNIAFYNNANNANVEMNNINTNNDPNIINFNNLNTNNLNPNIVIDSNALQGTVLHVNSPQDTRLSVVSNISSLNNNQYNDDDSFDIEPPSYASFDYNNDNMDENMSNNNGTLHSTVSIAKRDIKLESEKAVEEEEKEKSSPPPEYTETNE